MHKPEYHIEWEYRSRAGSERLRLPREESSPSSGYARLLEGPKVPLRSRQGGCQVVTSSALYKKRGVFSRDVKRVDFEKVQNSSYTQTAVGNVMGYGHVGISSAGGAGVEMRFASVRAPKQVQAMISRYRSDEQGADERPDEEVLEEILAELRAIRSAVEDTDVSNRNSPSHSVAVSHDETELDK